MNHDQSSILNIVPVKFSSEKIEVGKMPGMEKDAYQKLRETNWQSHVFRFDHRTQEIFNIPLLDNAQPLGEKIIVDISASHRTVSVIHQ